MVTNRPQPSGSKNCQDDDESQDEDQMEYDCDEGGTVVDGIWIPPPIDVTPALSTGSRLIILKVENSFFKSYPASAIVGPFHKCFNAIVGPNGNGKSNIIDSLLFVFGYRATKIRSKKLSVLIHKSELHPNVQSCTVAVHFAEIIDEEGDGYRIIPDSKFVVSRTACKDSSSYYQLNDRKVHFKEISILLKKHGVDLDHNRFLILQGEVEQIAMMKPKAENESECGLLEYLEDIIGTFQYKKPLMLLNEKVEIYSDARSEKLNRVKLVENEMNEMKEPMEEAVKFLKTENTIVIKRNLIYQGQIYDFTKQLDQVLDGKRKIEDTHKEFMQKFEKIKEEQHEKSNILKQEQARFDQLTTRKESLKEAFSNAEKKRVHLTETMAQLNKSRIKNKEQILEEKRKIEKLKSKTENHTKLIQEMEEKVEEWTALNEQYIEEKTKLLESFKTETKGLQEKKEGMQNDLVVLKKAVDETKTAFSLAESELQIYTSTEENEKTKLEDLRNTLQTVISTIEERKQQVDQLKKKIPATEKSLQSAIEDLRKEKYEEHQVVQEIRDKRAQLEERKSSMQASQSRGKVLSSLTEQKREGKCPGLYGRLGDLGAINKKYDVAISTACGPLDNIVVDTVDTAEWCIEFLKKYDLGRATFIALDKQEHLRQLANRPIKTPENVPRLYDLIEIQDEDVRTAFYYALRDTLVADNIDQATRIAYGAQRYRVVTLNGDLIETSGTMSGGGKSVSRGRMGQSVRVSTGNPKELENLARTLEEMEQQVRESQRKQHSLDSQINTLQPELRQMKFDLEKFSMELKALHQQRPELEVQLKEQESRCKSIKANPEQVKKLQDVVERKRAAYEEASETANALQQEVDKITKEIKDKTSTKLKVVDKSINETTKKISMCKDDITKMSVAIKTAERDCKKSTEKINNMEQEIKNMEKQLREFMEQSNEIEDDAKKLLTCLEEITEQLAEVEKSYKDIKNIASKLKEKEDKLKLQKVDIENELKTVTGEEDTIKATMHQLEVKISRLQLSEYEGNTEHELKKYTPEEIENTNFSEVERDLQNAENYIKVAKPNLNIIEQYNKVRDVYLKRFKELEEVINKRTKVKEHLDELRKRRKEEFLKGYNLIRMKVKEMYQTLTLEGDADFDLVDNYDPFSEGIQFNVRPPKKSWKKISNLSGGEKTLSSLALVFALHHYKPSPFYFMDEIDAALDFKNVSLVGNYIKDRTKNAQFIIISLRPNMYELADYLIGIYKVNDCTNCITFDPRQYEKVNEDDQVVPMVSEVLCSTTSQMEIS